MRGRARGDSAMHELGGHAGLLEKHGEWLGSTTGPHTIGSVDGKDSPGCATRHWSLMGKVTHLCRV